jgi:hypothetical protein
MSKMDGIKDIKDLLSQPMIGTIADAAMQFLQGIANPQPSGKISKAILPYLVFFTKIQLM